MKCKKIGHWAICCKNHCRETNEIIKENIKFLGEIKESINQKEEDWTRRVRLQIGSYQEQVSLKIDTGASVTVIPFSKYLPKMRQSTTILKGPNNTHIEVIGCFDAIVTYKGKSMKEEIFILEKQTVGLLSRRLSVGLGIVKLIDDIDNRLFEGLGSLEYTYKIEMNDNIKPTSIYVPRPVPIHQQEKDKEELDRMMSLNVIEEANSPTDWCSPMVVAIKGNGKIRICTDMTKFNKAVKREVYPMATVESSLAKIKGKIFSKLDANITSSPKHPQGNSVAERGVQTIKNILSKEDDPYLGLLAYRSTPLSFGISPAELLMGRRLNTTVPEIPKGLRRIN